MIKIVLWGTGFAVAAGLIQSTLLAHLSFFRTIPDLALYVLVYFSYLSGSMPGQIVGFASGVALDLLSAAPLGLNALVRTTLGAAVGFLKGSFFLDILILPVLLCTGSTLLKALSLYIVHLVFAGATPYYRLSDSTIWIELLYGAIIAPALFAFLGLFKGLFLPRKG
jgi:rod shape-determining protein MreD